MSPLYSVCPRVLIVQVPINAETVHVGTVRLPDNRLGHLNLYPALYYLL
jgi:hypothetical protein